VLKGLVEHTENISVHIIIGGTEKKESADHPAKMAGVG